MKITSRGDHIHDGKYSIHSRFSSVVNYCCNGWLLSFVSPEIGNGPVNIVVGDRLLPLADELVIHESCCELGTETIVLTDVPVFYSKLKLPEPDLEIFRTNLTVIRETLVSRASALSLAFLFEPQRKMNFTTGFERNMLRRFENAIAKIDEGQLTSGVNMLSGLGQGLTPAGDDFISGMLLALWVMEYMKFEARFEDIRRSIETIVQTENIISRSAIVHAAAGHFSEHVIIFANRCVNADFSKDDACILQILNVGESSGADMLSGFLFTFASDKIHGFQEKI